MTYEDIAGRMPEKVFQYFQEICQIPHGSENTKAISDYLVDFAKARSLEWYQDEADNVIIWKKATAGYENAPVTMLQGHTDMVCQVESGKEHNFLTDPITLLVDGDELHADGTTLGGDDGIAVAYALAILDSDEIPHPALECVFTSDEEIGMVGAAQLDFSLLKAKYLLNLDSEDEGVFLAGCAGGVHYDLSVPVQTEEATGTKVSIELKGLTGGHSGSDIKKGRGFAGILGARLVQELSDTGFSFHIASIKSGLADNAISRSCQIELLADADTDALLQEIKKIESVFQDEFHVTDPRLNIAASAGEKASAIVLTKECGAKVLSFVLNAPSGIQKMSQDLPDQVETSLNLGILSIDEKELKAGFLLRSSRETGKKALARRLELYTALFGGTYNVSGDYPGWEFLTISPLRDLMMAVYEEQSGKKAVVENIHAGVECGLFTSHVPGLDAVSFGPDMRDIHSPSEALSISSVNRTWSLLLEVLKRIQ